MMNFQQALVLVRKRRVMADAIIFSLIRFQRFEIFVPNNLDRAVQPSASRPIQICPNAPSPIFKQPIIRNVRVVQRKELRKP